MKKTILFAILALSSSGYGQTLKGLSYNAANGQVVYSSTNPLTFTNFYRASGGLVVTGPGLEVSGLLMAGTNASIAWDEEVAKAATRTNLGLPWGGLTNTNDVTFQTALFTSDRRLYNDSGITAVSWDNNQLSLLDPISWPYLGGSTAAATTRTNLGLGATWLTNNNVTNFRTAIGLGATDSVVFNSLDLDSLPSGSSTGFVGHSSGVLQIRGTNVSTGTPAFFGWDGFNPTAIDVGTARTNLGLGATNDVTFSNATISGTLTATGNVTMSGTANTAPNQTAAAGSSVMTRDLLDLRAVTIHTSILNFNLGNTIVANNGVSTPSRGAWRLLTFTNLSSRAARWFELQFVASTPIRVLNFSNRMVLSFTRYVQGPRSGNITYVQCGRDELSATNFSQLAVKGFGVQFSNTTVTPFVHDGTNLTSGTSATAPTAARYFVDFRPNASLDFYIMEIGSEPVLVSSVTNGLPTGTGVSTENIIEFYKGDTGSGGANSSDQFNNGWIYIK